MKNFLKITFSIIACLFLFSFLIITPLQAQTSDVSTSASDNQMLDRLQNIAQEGGYVTDEQTASAPRIVGLIIRAFTSILGVIFVILMVIAGFTWMTSSGNEEKIKKATATIKAATIGLILTLSAWAIWKFIFERLIVGK